LLAGIDAPNSTAADVARAMPLFPVDGAQALSKICADGGEELVSGLDLRSGGLTPGVEDVLAHMAVEDLGHERSAARSR